MESISTLGNHSGKSESIWMVTSDRPSHEALARNERADVIIVGAGIAGLSTAYLLGRAGKSVVVLDDGPIASGESERTTAHLTCVLDDRYFELEWLHGEKGARMIAESHSAAIDEIERIVLDEKIDCDFLRVDGYLFTPRGGDKHLLDKELQAGNRAALSDLEIVARAPLGSDTGRCLRFPNQAQFHPLKYMTALANAIKRDGGRIFTNSHVTKIQGGEQAHVEVEGGFTVSADSIVVATNTPINDLLTMHTKQAAYRNYVVGAKIPAGSVQQGLYWDTLDPYHYVRLQTLSDPTSSDASDVLIVGGEDFKTGQADDAEERYAKLEAWTRERFPEVTEFHYRWSGQTMESVDGLGFIGRNPLDKDNVFIATGFSGNGMTYGTITGMLLTDMILGRENSWTTLYDPSRKTLRAAQTFAEETINMVIQYGDWLTAGDVEDVASIPAGTGAIVRHGLTKHAVYRDDEGKVHELSAVCPHLGAILAWNHSEKTWDCPCHGSRFDAFGNVVNGPANTNLPEVEQFSQQKSGVVGGIGTPGVSFLTE